MKVNVVKIEVHLLIFLFILLPFLPSLREIFPIFSFGSFTIIGSLRDIIIIISILGAIYLLKIRNLKTVTTANVFLGIYILIGFTHLINENLDLSSALNAFRLQFLVPIFIFLAIEVYNKKNIETIFSFDTFIKIMVFTSIVVSGLAIIEFFDPGIRETLYGNRFEDVQKVLSIPGVKNIRSVSTLGNPINLSLFLLISILASVYGFSQKSIRIFCIILLPLAVTAIILTFTRTSYVLLTMFALLYFINNFFINSKKGSKTKAIIFLLIIISSLVYFSVKISDNFYELFITRIQQFSEAFGPNSDPRIDNWKIALNHIFSFPPTVITGIGLGMSSSSSDTLNQYMIENTYITLFVEMGLLGLFFFSLLLLKLTKNATYIYKHNNQLGLFLILFTIFFTFASLTSDLHRNNPISTYFFFIYYFSHTTLKQIKLNANN